MDMLEFVWHLGHRDFPVDRPDKMILTTIHGMPPLALNCIGLSCVARPAELKDVGLINLSQESYVPVLSASEDVDVSQVSHSQGAVSLLEAVDYDFVFMRIRHKNSLIWFSRKRCSRSIIRGLTRRPQARLHR